MKLEINNRRKFGEITNMQKLYQTLLNSQCVKEEIERKIAKYFEMNENKTTTNQISWDAAKAVIQRNVLL